MADYKARHALGETVYLKTGDERDRPWIVVGVTFTLAGATFFTCARGDSEGRFSAGELRTTPDFGSELHG